jgi:cupin
MLRGESSIQFPKHEGIKCYALISGECWLSVESVRDAVHLKSGDCFVLPRGLPFRLASDFNLPLVDAQPTIHPLAAIDSSSVADYSSHHRTSGPWQSPASKPRLPIDADVTSAITQFFSHWWTRLLTPETDKRRIRPDEIASGCPAIQSRSDGRTHSASRLSFAGITGSRWLNARLLPSWTINKEQKKTPV